MIGAILLLIAIILLVIAYTQFKKTQDLLKRGITTTAKVIAIHKTQNTSTDTDGFTTTSTGYAPELEFTTESGEKTTYTSSISTSNKNAWHEGDTVEIVYDPNDTSKVKIKKGLYLYFTSALTGGIGIIFLLIGIAFLFAH